VNFNKLAEGLRLKGPAIKEITAFVGFDGTVDSIIDVVDIRSGLGSSYKRLPTIASFGKRVLAASGKSTNLEAFVRQEKIGGNSAIMAGALAAAGAKTTLVADMGRPEVHSVFAPLQKKAVLKSLGEPTRTSALEFDDGKVMLCATANHEEITFANVVNTCGGMTGLRRELQKAKLVGLVNWTMIPGMTEIFKKLQTQVLPGLKGERIFFFDLADPEKRSDRDIREALVLIGKFERFGKAVLGVNLKESREVCEALGLCKQPDVLSAARRIRGKLGIFAVAVHLNERAVISSKAGESAIHGPYTPKPLITTGAGDHFNAGMTLGLSLGGTPEEAITLGVAFSGCYVRTGKSPSFKDALALIKKGW
jgi:hypothetical protein